MGGWMDGRIDASMDDRMIDDCWMKMDGCMDEIDR
jgi:hypothetical protein